MTFPYRFSEASHTNTHEFFPVVCTSGKPRGQKHRSSSDLTTFQAAEGKGIPL